MKRFLGCLALVACHGGGSTRQPAPITPAAPPRPNVEKTAPPPPAVTVAPRDLSRPSQRAIVTGTIHDTAGKPIAGARACAEGDRGLDITVTCAVTDATGSYRLELEAGSYTLDASAKGYVPAAIRPAGKWGIDALPGGTLDALDVVLDPGASEITGTVTDTAGAPIAGARVTARAGWGRIPGMAVTETDAAGKYSLWTLGDARISASAEGYAAGGERLIAPGIVDLRLPRAAAIEGTVVDGTGTPIQGIRVEAVSNGWSMRSAVTDARGAFRLSTLSVGRYRVIVRDAGLVSAPAPSFVALPGQTMRGERVIAVPGRRVAGTVTVIETGAGCPRAVVALTRSDLFDLTTTTDDDGRFVFDAVAPDTYPVRVSCPEHRTGSGYPELVVGDSDLSNLEWKVAAGLSISGRVRTRAGRPAAGVFLTARNPSDRFNTQSASSRTDGTYTLRALEAGTYYLDVANETGALAKPIEVTVTTKPVTRDITIGPGFLVAGRVVDDKGSPLARITVSLEAASPELIHWRKNRTVTASDGTFEFRSLPPGRYTVTAAASWIDREDAKPSAAITASATRPKPLPQITMPAPALAIRGIVVDARGAPVRDAEVSSSSITTYSSADGTFVLDRVAPHTTQISATSDRIAYARVTDAKPGATVRLTIPDLGSISGVIRRANGAPLDDATIEITGETMIIERVSDPGGRFTLRDLAPGTYQLTVRVPSFGSATVDLASGQRKQGVQILLK